MNLRERLIDPKSPDRRPRKAAYALPTLFTAGNLFLGFLATVKTVQGALELRAGSLGPNELLSQAALMIGVAVFLDGLDGRIARMTNTVSDFGRELDSLADVITFGVAPAVLAWVWGFEFIDRSGIEPEALEHLRRLSYFVVFLYVMCGASRLARFNITTNPVPKNPGRPDRRYFVGLPIPAAAAMVAATVYAANSAPLEWWPLSAAWIALLGLLSFLMVSTWRYRSFKDFDLFTPRSTRSFILQGSLIYLIWNYSHVVLFLLSFVYVTSGILIRLGGLIKRRFKPVPPPEPHHQIG
ncbi:MAG: CDP-diacylglycerol--serine O-phosphatidyltransferase [Bryobacterales bacterium]|nr:CDP-diacylglycerol--serine O-phosphatidyltransferase [Bryobacterales bacterium]